MDARRLPLLLAAAVIVATLAPVSQVDPAQASGCFRFKPAEKLFAAKINHTRSYRGLRPLHLDPQLGYTARYHNRRMVRKGYLFHTSLSQFESWVTRWTSIGENVGYGGGVDALYKAFLHSPEHYANIVGKSYHYVGVGVKKVGGTVWVTIQFEGSRDPGTRLDMPRVCS